MLHIFGFVLLFFFTETLHIIYKRDFLIFDFSNLEKSKSSSAVLA